MTADEADTALRRIEGHELDAVTFVRDYVQFRFDGPILNAYVWPVLHVGTEQYSIGMRGYRDELCSRIGCTVRSAKETVERVTLSLSDGSSMHISLRDEDRLGPEALLLDDGAGQVWNIW